MTHQIQVPDDLYNQLSAIAEARGRQIKPGRGSGLVATLRELAEMCAPFHADTPDELWMRFNARITPSLNELMVEAARHGERVEVNFSAKKGISIKRISD